MHLRGMRTLQVPMIEPRFSGVNSTLAADHVSVRILVEVFYLLNDILELLD